MGDDGKNTDVASMTFEQAMAELDQVVSKLESGSAPLDQSIDLYTRGTALKARCEALLADAQARIEKITLNEQKQVTGTESFDADS